MKLFAKVDAVLLVTTIVLLIFGLMVFSSAALGVLSSNEVKFYNVIETQLVYALLGGCIALLLGLSISFKFYERYAIHLFLLSLAFTALVFIPGLQMYHGGAHRWIQLGGLSLQPSEALKFAFVIVVAYWCSKYGEKFKFLRYGFFPYVVACALIALVMLLQPDFGTFIIMLSASFAVYFVGGARLKHLGLLILAGVLGFVLLVSFRPYMMERITTLFNSTHDVHGSSWQLNQSLIAIGSGGFFGRGYGQSVQKFNYLPEPIGDSVFAVMGEELGLIGILFLFLLYGIVIVRGCIIALRSESHFGRLLAFGISCTLLAQICLNIGSMVGILPLTGVPLPLVSHGGTALLATLFEIGVLLRISRQTNTL